ncbi:MAG: GntR family transcriptional regulator [Negativicutes bacterium]|nr:GntR family transcriptional regulator [Negativicutes bacterium]
MTSLPNLVAPGGLSLREKAYEVMKNQIITGKLPPGIALNERELVADIGVSRTPIREALNRLEKEHLVVITPQKGAAVSPITPKVINDIFQLREVLEPYVIGVVTPTFPEAELRRFQTSFSAPPIEECDLLAKIDREFHSAIVYSFGNDYLNHFMENMYIHNERIRFLSLRLPQRLAESVDEHLTIIEAMLTRDPQQAAAAMRTHLASARYAAFRL